MKWLFIASVGIAGVIVLVVAIGALLPRDHVAAMSLRVAATPDSVWSTITDAAGYPAWRADVQRVEILPPVATGSSWREQSNHGAITYVVEASEPPRRFMTRIADDKLPFGGGWEYRIEPAGANASTVTIVERGSVYNPVFRFVSRFIMGHTATLDLYLRALGARFGGADAPTAVVMES